MPDKRIATIPFGPLNLAVADEDAPAGTLRQLENLCWIGASDRPRLSPVELASVEGSASNPILAAHWHVRQQRGPYSEQSDSGLERWVCVTEAGVELIDPANGGRLTTVYTLPTDTTRRAQFAQLGEALFIATRTGPGQGTPEVVLELRDDTAFTLEPPALPTVSVTSTGGSAKASTGSTDRLEAGTYAFRYAWLLEDGTIGPPSAPTRLDVGSASDTNVYTLTFTIDSYPEALPGAWAERLEGLVVFVSERQAYETDEGDTSSALLRPFFRAAQIDDTTPGQSTKWGDTSEAITSYDRLEEGNLLEHRVAAGAIESYNRRLLLGDVEYDFKPPRLERYLDWTDGVTNANGNDFWIRLSVRIQTQGGTYRRFSEAIPLDAAAASSVTLAANEMFAYPDRRATSWELYVSTDYEPGQNPGSWYIPTLANVDRSLAPSPVANLAYTDLTGEGPWDVTGSSSFTTDADSDFTGAPAEVPAFTVDSGFSSDSRSDVMTATVADIEGTGETLERIVVQGELSVDIDGDGSASASIKVVSKDTNGDVLATDTATLAYAIPSNSDETGFELTDVFQATVPIDAAATTIEVTASASAQIDSSSSVITVSAGPVYADAVISTTNTPAGDPLPASSATDRDPNRFLYSEVFQPRGLAAERVLYVGEGPEDTILAIEPISQEVSQGQYGEYPLLIFGAESVHALGVQSGGPFISQVAPMAGHGLVGREALVNVNGRIFAATSEGLVAFTPQPSDPLSAPLHRRDTQADILDELGPGTAVGRLQHLERDRDEIWVATSQKIYAFSLKHGRWFTIDRTRTGLTRRGVELVGIDGGLTLEAGSTNPANFQLGTAALTMDQPFRWKRLRRVGLRQTPRLDEVTIRALALPDAGPILLAETTIQPSINTDVLNVARGGGHRFRIELDGQGTPDQQLHSLELRYEARYPDRMKQ